MRTKKEKELLKRMPQPGDFGLSTIGGWLGFWINIGQALARSASRYTHAFIVLDDETVLEAMPGGARIVPLSNYLGRAVFSDVPLTDEQRRAIVNEARALEGTPYSFLDYLSLALLHWKIRPDWLKNYIESSGHQICSQLVDFCWMRGGFHIFKDNRLPQDVMPGDLANWLIEREWL